MEFRDVVRKRRMVRNYDPSRPVDRAVVEKLLEYAIRAPSAGFSQGWHFLVLADAEDRDRFWAATSDPGQEPDSWLRGLQSAPVLILALSDKDAYLDRYAEPDKGWTDRAVAEHWPVPYWDIDTGMASLLILLGAVDEGLASCFFGVPVECTEQVHEAFAIPDRLTVVGVVSLGYGAPDRKSPSLRRGRRSVSEVVSYGRVSVGRNGEVPATRLRSAF
ncbi:MAG TPA: nitroreductase family protein [Jatrophihabitans sp.]|jgi:nitroreductase